MSIETKTFDEQWAQPQRLRIGEGSIPVYDAIPSAVAGTPIILCQGWLERPHSLWYGARALHKRGRRILLADTAEEKGVGVFPALIKLASLMPPLELRRAACVLGLLEEKKIASVDIVAHSEGALFALAAAAVAPASIQKILLINPAGFFNSDTFMYLMGRFSREMLLHEHALADEAIGKEQFHPDQFRRGGSDIVYGLEFLLRHPLETLQSGRAIAQSTILPLTQKALDSGIQISVLSGERDRIFPPVRIKKTIDKRIKLDIVPRGSHVWHLLEPERYAKLVCDVLCA